MKVLNPLFDTVFKYLMEDLEIAKAIIQAVIKKEIIEITPAPQESTDKELKIKYLTLGMIRNDYVAVIKTITDTGKEIHERVMIEVQKSPIEPEIGRFRNYIADKYRKKSIVEGKEVYLPLKTIYLIEKPFNRNLPAVLGHRGSYYDELEDTLYMGEKDDLVELFNHDSWFIQTELLPADFKNELMYVLSVFAPQYKSKDEQRYINLPDEEILAKKHRVLERVYRRLQAATQDKEVNDTVEIEMDIEGFIEKQIAEKEQALKEIEEAKKREEEAKQKIRQAIEMMRSLGATGEQIEKALDISLKDYNL
jgi:hypothetical protein